MPLRCNGSSTALKCAAYFALGGWLTYFCIRSGEQLDCGNRGRELIARDPQQLAGFSTLEQAGAAGIIEAREIPFAHPNGAFPDRDDRLKPEKWLFSNLS